MNPLARCVGSTSSQHDLKNVFDLAPYLIPTSSVSPRDFDVSPYFKVITLALENGFEYHRPDWADRLPDVVQHGAST